MYRPKYSVILGNVGNCTDRYMDPPGYSNPFSIEQLFDRVSAIKHVEAVELVAGAHIRTDNVKQIKDNLERTGLKVSSIIPSHTGQQKWKSGSFASKDPSIRRDAVSHTKEMMDIAAELDCDIVSIWPGQDGYDYYFQSNYIDERGWFEEGVKECCKYNKNIRVALEYKPKEPRNRSFISNVYSTLLSIHEIGEANCGVTIDFGHALEAYENPAEAVAVLKKYGDKLFHVHMNDNYSLWDDDMIAGSVHTIAYIEFLYWLRVTGFNGWISMDQYPYREDGKKAVSESIEWMVALNEVVEGIDDEEVKKVIKTGDATESSRMLRKYILGR